ncbi:serine/threonine receptor-like kinase NFP [Curcuma longa]|uniref:serine/threonine receptor-like kinase NFP n=1 Tax=Curcuma longa TaxID=136217 RepID=UPI003D9F1AC2
MSFSFFLLSLGLLLQSVDGQTPPLSDGVPCAANRSIYPCSAYALYRAAADQLPAFDLASVGDLFGASRLSVARSSNLSATGAALRPDQPLLIPLTCSCNSNRSFAAIPYQIAAGDTFYQVSTFKFGNLTSYPAVELENPTLIPTNLPIGVTAVFPIFCRCLELNMTRRPLGLVTYVLQPSDTYASVAASFATDVRTLIALNGPQNVTFSVIFVPLYQIPPPLLLSNSSPARVGSPDVENDRDGVITGLAIGLGITGFLLLLSVISLWISTSKDGKTSSNNNELASPRNNAGKKEFAVRSSEEDKLVGEISEWLDKYKVYSIEELKRSTCDFAPSCRVKGSVYKGIMHGEAFAIKKMKWNAMDELKILQKVNHSNLVKLEGFCIDYGGGGSGGGGGGGGGCYLVYEFVENGSLDRWLHSPALARKLDWRARVRIALDLANGLQYIHEHTWPRVVHKDVKTSNVLLDHRLRAKVANFGLARAGFNAVTTHIVGTQGYVAPEYLADGLVTTKMDVFAYGVVLLELVSGREAAGANGQALWAEAERTVFGREKEAVAAWMDSALASTTCALESVVAVVELARECLRKDPTRRPSMIEVAYTLSKAEEPFADDSAEGLSVDDESSSNLHKIGR